MIKHVIYTNHLGESIVFGKDGVFITSSDLLDFSWSVEKENSKITGFERDIVSKSATISIKGRTPEENIVLKNRLFEIFEKDVLAKKEGKFIIGDYYLKCFVTESKKSKYIKNSNYIVLKLKIVTSYPFWCQEVTKSFFKGNEAVADEETAEEFLYYPFGYPYQYSMPKDAGFLQNDHYAACDFKMTIYGPCTNPSILINGHLHEVMATLYTGEYLLIDSRENTVFRYLNDGRTENLFNWRNKDNNLFEKIPSGRCSVLWNTEAFGFDIVLFQERSEPKWIL